MGHIAQSFWRRFFNFVNVFSLFPNYLLFGMGVALHLNKLESSLPEPSLVEIGRVVLEQKIFISCEFIFIISQLSPLWEGLDPSFEQT